jgi:transposase
MEYYGIDAHKRYSVFTCMNERGKVSRHGRIANDPQGIAHMLGEPRCIGEAQVVLEATGCWPHLYDLLEGQGVKVVLAHPQRVKAIAHARVKTDTIDATTLAHLLRSELIPEAYIPPPEVRQLRELVRARAALVRVRTQLKNLVHGLLTKRGLRPPVTDVFGKRGRQWLEGLSLPHPSRGVLQAYLALIDSLSQQIKGLEEEIARRAEADPQARLLKTIPGVGNYTAMVLLAEIGEVKRFPDHRHLVSYAGLAPRVAASGGRVWTGRITKAGSPLLRWVLTEAAQRVARRPGPLREIYLKQRWRHGIGRATIALARKLLVMAYYVLKRKEAYGFRG